MGNVKGKKEEMTGDRERKREKRQGWEGGGDIRELLFRTATVNFVTGLAISCR